MINVDILGFLGKALDKVIPNAADRDAAKLNLVKLQQSGEFRELDAAMAAIIAESKSEHAFVALARPAYLYVIYIFILSALPIGVLYAFNPESAANITIGVKAWLDAIPESYLQLFGIGYLGYTGARSFDKRTNKPK